MEKKMLSYSNIGFSYLFLTDMSHKILILLCLEHFTKIKLLQGY